MNTWGVNWFWSFVYYLGREHLVYPRLAWKFTMQLGWPWTLNSPATIYQELCLFIYLLIDLVLWFILGALDMLGEHSTNWTTSQIRRKFCGNDKLFFPSQQKPYVFKLAWVCRAFVSPHFKYKKTKSQRANLASPPTALAGSSSGLVRCSWEQETGCEGGPPCLLEN